MSDEVISGVVIEVVSDGGDRSVLRFRGEFDVASMPAAWAALDPHLTPNRHVTLDLSELWFLDSSGLRVFVECALRQRANGGSFGVDSVSPAVQRLFEVAGVTEFLRAPNPDDG